MFLCTQQLYVMYTVEPRKKHFSKENFNRSIIVFKRFFLPNLKCFQKHEIIYWVKYKRDFLIAIIDFQ